MPFTIYVRMKTLGNQKDANLTPIPFILDTRPLTVRELLTALTKLGVKKYNSQKDEGRILTEDAIESAIQCFEDGIYRVFAKDTELTALSDVIPWSDDLIFTFIRLTMLAGLPRLF